LDGSYAGSVGFLRLLDGETGQLDGRSRVVPRLTRPYVGDSIARHAARLRGRSLRDLDMTTRMMCHPCSYMIDAPAFDGLPAVAREAIYIR
jgi:hypothetical protein